MRRPLVLFVLFFFIFIGLAVAQDTPTTSTQSANCTQVLRLARAVYEQGRLHELETLLKDCLAGEVGATNGFATTQEKVDAYRLLCLSYIYLEEPAKADEAMLGILNTDHFFALNPTDPAEFQALYRTFRTEPIFNWGAKIAGNFNMAHLLKVYPVGSGSAGYGTYKPGITFSGAVFAEREFFPKAKDGSFLRNTLVRADIYYMIRGNKITYDRLWTNTSSLDLKFPAATAEGKLSTSWLEFNVIARYRYNRKSLWDPYIGLGPGTSILFNATMNLAKFEWKRYVPDAVSPTTTAGNSYSGPSIDVKSAYYSFPIYASVVWGVNRKFGELYFNFEARYQYGFSNHINSSSRTIPELTDYAITLNDYAQSNILINVGVSVPKFSPKKLKKK